MTFECIDCHRRIVPGPYDMPRMGLCIHCWNIPQWWRDAPTREMIDPRYDRAAAIESQLMFGGRVHAFRGGGARF